MNWLILFSAGLLEVIWAVGLTFTAGFTRPFPSIITLIAMGGSFYLLSLALRTLPLGTAYAVWVGIGVIGAAIAGALILNESLNLYKILSLVLIVVGIAGLKLTSAS